MESCIYEGTVSHRRFGTPEHAFRYPLFMMYLDLDEVEEALAHSNLWSARSPNLAWFRREDFHGDPRVPLIEAVRASVRNSLGSAPTGPVRMLAHLRYYGHSFNPVVFYYLFGDETKSEEAAVRPVPESVVAEITNTPWGERHAYVLPWRQADDLSGERFDKRFHVSPYFDMNHEYDWRFAVPGDKLDVTMTNYDNDRRVFTASLALERREIAPASLRRVLFRYPAHTLRVLAAIYVNAAKLWWKGATFFPHPDKRTLSKEVTPS